jgi:Fur family iron response transcriptional regulator
MPDVEINKPALIALDGVVTIPNREPIPAGCPRYEIDEILQSAGPRPTRQRMALGALLFGKGPRHLTAEMLYEEAIQANVFLSLATVYNTLNQLTDVGVLRQVSVGGAKTYFDTNVTSHHHFYIESSHELVDVPHSEIVLRDLPDLPEGYEISRVDIVVRLKKKRH